MSLLYIFKFILFSYIIEDFFTLANNNHTRHRINETNMLWCRTCGVFVADVSRSLNIISQGALKVENRNILGKNITVQTLANPFNYVFEVLLTKKANCMDIGRNVRADSWFPGYSWRACTCTQCETQLGWTFERALTNDIEDTANMMPFHALILTSLLGITNDKQIAELTSPHPPNSRWVHSSTTRVPTLYPRARDDPAPSKTPSASDAKIPALPLKDSENVVKTRTTPDADTIDEGRVVVLVGRPRSRRRTANKADTVTGNAAVTGTYAVTETDAVTDTDVVTVTTGDIGEGAVTGTDGVTGTGFVTETSAITETPTDKATIKNSDIGTVKSA